MTSDQGPGLTDRQRHTLEAALALALLLTYRGTVRESLDRLGRIDVAVAITAEQHATIAAFAAKRAEQIQRGVARFTAAALADLPDDASADQRQQALQQAHQSMDRYNNTVLAAFLISWAKHRALIDTYTAQDATDPQAAAAGQTAADERLWSWQQSTDFPDECGDAMDASPAPLDDLLSITGGPPPRHERCQCELSPS